MKNKIFIILPIIVLFFIWYIVWIYSVIRFVLSILLYLFFIYVFLVLIKKIFWKKVLIFDKQSIAKFYYKSIINLSIIFIIIWMLFSSFTYTQLYKNPLKLGVYTISNWEKTIIFQSMMHIWSKEFYDNVKNNILNHKNNWYVLFFEWVKRGSDENYKKFNSLLWIEFEEDIYKNFANIYWLNHQDNNMFLNLVNNNDYNIDIWIDEVIDLFEKKQANFIYSDAKPLKLDVSVLDNLNNKQLYYFKLFNKAILSYLLKNNSIQNLLQNNLMQKDLFDIILNKRNKYIVDYINQSEYNNIILMYWWLHFDWIFDLLKKQDIKWQIKKIDYLKPIN